MDDKIIRPGETPADYIIRRIGDIFIDLAEQLAETDMDEEQTAGVPMQLMRAQSALQSAFRLWVKQQEMTVPED